jgi:uncharacterized repeat protein (TIGR03987 family)
MGATTLILINLALAFYSIGVWSERFAGRLKVWHMLFFWAGVVCDTWGTGLMFKAVGGLTYDIHGLTGLLAIFLMLIHVIWASAVLLRKNEKLIQSFHKFSVFVWFIWLIPYLSPMAIRIFGGGQ